MTSPLDTALIVPFDLPPGLEDLRRRCVPDAMAGLAAHATAMYPFAYPEALDEAIRARLEKLIFRGSRPTTAASSSCPTSQSRLGQRPANQRL